MLCRLPGQGNRIRGGVVRPGPTSAHWELLQLGYKGCEALNITTECHEPSQGQEDVAPDDPLKEAVVSLWNYDVVPKPNIKDIQIQMTLPILTDGSQSPYWVL